MDSLIDKINHETSTRKKQEYMDEMSTLNESLRKYQLYIFSTKLTNQK